MQGRSSAAVLVFGVPSVNMTVFHRLRHGAHDPAAVIDLPTGRRVMIVRDVELAQVRAAHPGVEVHAYEAFVPEGGLSGDREIRAAQSTAEFLRRAGVRRVVADRSLPLLVADELGRAGVGIQCDRELGIAERRRKDEREVEALRVAQEKTQRAVRHACELIGQARVGAGGVLLHPRDGEVLTSERVKAEIDGVLALVGCSSDGHIVAGGPGGADCHFSGAGVLRTGEPVIVDVFPRDRSSGYFGDCTRTVVHGEAPAEVVRLHGAVVEAKRAAVGAARAGVTGREVHSAATEVLTSRGFGLGFPPEGMLGATSPTGFCSMPHGTGHGLGLSLKEPPLLDATGPELRAQDAVTIEPGLYAPGLGGVRIEDLYIIREGGCDLLGVLEEGLRWA